MWAAIIGAIGSIVGGVLNYTSGQSAQGEARQLSQQERGDVLGQRAIENKRAQQELDFSKQRFGYDAMMKGQEMKMSQEQTNRDQLEKTAKYFTDKANSSAMYRQQLLSLWK
jgi:hypothetical protein